MAVGVAAAAAAVKASQVTTEEDKSKQGKGQQVRNSQLDLDMKNKTISSAIARVMADSSIPAGTEKSYEALCGCHAAVRQTLYMEIKEQAQGSLAEHLRTEREAMMARLESKLQEFMGDLVPPGDVEKNARLIAACQPDANGKLWMVEHVHLVLYPSSRISKKRSIHRYILVK